MTHILLVEDDPTVSEVLTEFLVDLAHSVVTVETVAEARAVLDAEAVSAVVSDVRLPDGSGLDIASQAQHKSIAFGMVTGDVSYIGVFSEAGIHYLIKPFSFQEFRVFMAELLGRAA